MTTLDRVEPNLEFSFAVDVEGIVVGWFTECSSLSIEREVIPRPEGGVNNYITQLPGPIKWANITLKRGLAGPELWNWFEQGRYDGQVKRRKVTIILYKVDRTEARRWELNNAIPTKWTASNFKSDDNQVFLESLELVCGGGEASQTVQRALETLPSTTNAPAQKPEINQTELAQAVYRLLKQELRIEQDRLGRRHI